MSPSLFILTGAGISAESGLSTFRGAGGLWENHPIEDVASIDGYIRNPRLVRQFYNMRRRQILDPKIQPNPAHRALVELERKWPGEILLVTQNVDDLHERAGSQKLLHMHGELLKARCQINSKIFEWREDITDETSCPSCASVSCLRPHIVWFGEMPLFMDQIYKFLNGCDLFISIGTSGLVYPAAGFIAEVKSNRRAQTLEVNVEPTMLTDLFDQQLKGPSSEQVPRLVERLLSGEFSFKKN